MNINQGYELVAIDDLEPHPENPRQSDVGAIAVSIEVNGFYGAVVAQRSTKRILAGNHRWMAARAQGEEEVPTIWVDVDDETARRILLVDNRTNDLASYNDDLLAEILSEIAASTGLEGTGWDGDDLDQLIADLHAEDFSSDDEDPPPTSDHDSREPPE